jgi:hypothetical protein
MVSGEQDIIICAVGVTDCVPGFGLIPKDGTPWMAGSAWRRISSCINAAATTIEEIPRSDRSVTLMRDGECVTPGVIGVFGYFAKCRGTHLLPVFEETRTSESHLLGPFMGRLMIVVADRPQAQRLLSQLEVSDAGLPQGWVTVVRVSAQTPREVQIL